MTGLNTPDLITREYIHKQLVGQNLVARTLERELHAFAALHPELNEVALTPAFLEDKELSCISYYTFKKENVYAEHSMFFFTHAGYYEYTQLLTRNRERLVEIEAFYTSESLNFKRRLEAENRRLIDHLDRLASDIRYDANKLWEDPSLLFLYHHTLSYLPIDDLSAYKFMGVFNIINPRTICYLD